MVYENARILVTGATGNVGRLVVDALLARGARDVRALTVNPARAALPSGVEVVTGYLGRPASLPAALDGVDRLYLAPLPATAAEVCSMAAAAGVSHIVDLAGEKGGPWQVVEDAVEACGVPWTHLEPGEFMTNTGVWAAQITAGDEVRDTCGDVVNAPIALEDIAEIAAKVLLEDGHAGRSYYLTGPEAVSRREKVAALGAALGRELTFVDLPRDAGVEQLSLVMGEHAEWYVNGLESLAEYPQAVDPAAAELLGRPGMALTEWARRHADLFRPAEIAGR
ncbi:NAD(P)H-binding protein [Actinoplanes sp. NPDC051470]|uniref:SDR family oxidoreductase n=1 Tax=Actinoplanes sp. NPDC051470 TaxID=3157224 RepID=UPI0034270D4C